jgi:outer membrane protein OmpU
MKKLLLATSVLAATTGFAAAEVTVSGAARMGVVYDGDDAFFASRVRVTFNMVGTTDGGLEFGASVRADQLGGNGSTDLQSSVDEDGDGDVDADDVVSVGNQYLNGDSTVYIASNGFKLTMGDVGGAADALVGQVSGVGYGPNDSLQEIGFIGTTKTAVYAEYTTGALTFGLSSGQNVIGEEMSVAVKYSTDAFSVALGYEDDGAGTDVLHVSGSASFGAATVKVRISDDSVITPYALSVDYALGATTITAFYTDFDIGVEHIGIGAAYDLGGGASVKGGIVDNGTDTFADLGIVMSF